MIQYCPYHGEKRNPVLCPDCRQLRNVAPPLPRMTSIPRSPEDQGRLRILMLSTADGRSDKIMFIKNKETLQMRPFILLICVLSIFISSCASSGFVAGGPSFLENSDKLDSSSNTMVQAGVVTKADTNTGAQGEAAIVYDKGSFSTGGISGDTQAFSARLGLRYTWNPEGFLRPYLGAGFAPGYLKVKDSVGESEHAFALAGYAKAGIDVPLGKGWTVGAAYERTFGDKYSLGSAKDQDFSAGSVLLGIGFSL